MDNSLIMMSGSIYLISGSDGPDLETGSAHFKSNISLDTTDNSSLSITSNTSSFYMSSSGAIGINTTDPQSGFDVISNEVQFQKPGSRKGLRINDEGNIESFNKDAASATTGSEFILTYSKGAIVTAVSLAALGITVADNTAATAFYNALSAEKKNALLEKLEFYGFNQQPNIGDTIGSIRYVAESGSIGYNNRVGGEAASIKAVINDIDQYGVQADLIFSVAQKGGASVQKLLLDANGLHELTGSLTVKDGSLTMDGGTIYGTIYANEFSSIPSSSFAKTASFVTRLNQSVIITGSLNVTGSVVSTTGFTGSLQGTASFARTSQTASYVLNAVSSSFVSTASFTLNSITTASVSSNTITFTKGNGTTFPITVSPGGSTTEIQYNNAGAFAGTSTLTFDGTTITANPITATGYFIPKNALGQCSTFGSDATISGPGVYRFFEMDPGGAYYINFPDPASISSGQTIIIINADALYAGYYGATYSPEDALGTAISVIGAGQVDTFVNMEGIWIRTSRRP